MRIPVISSHRTRALHVPGRCAACGADKGFDVAHRYVSVWAAFLPMAARTLGVEGRCGACGGAAPKDVLDRIHPNPLLRFGWLFFLVLPLVAVGGYVYVDGEIRHARYEEQRKKEEKAQWDKEKAEEERKSVLAACTDAYKKASAAKKACFSSLDDIENPLAPDVSKVKPLAPTDASVLKGAPVAVLGDAIVPESPYFGGSPCPLDVPYDFELDTTCYKIYSDGSLSAVRDRTQKTIDATQALERPDRWATVAFKCNDWSCSATAIWVDAKANKLLAVVRVTKPKTDAGANGEDGDKGALAKMLGDALAKWK